MTRECADVNVKVRDLSKSSHCCNLRYFSCVAIFYNTDTSSKIGKITAIICAGELKSFRSNLIEYKV